MEKIKFTPEELTQLKDLRTKYSEISHELGQVQLNRHSLDKTEASLFVSVDDIQSKERKLAELLKNKYGQGSIDIDTGEFLPPN